MAKAAEALEKNSRTQAEATIIKRTGCKMDKIT
jgi:hypothetical protein